MPEKVVRPTVDAWVGEASPDANHAGAARLNLNGGGGGDDRQAFIHFPRPFPRGVVIAQATLTVYLAAAWSGANEITAKRVTQKWFEDITWNERPNVTATNAASETVTDGVTDQEVQIDVTAMVQDAVSNDVWKGFRLEVDVDANLRLHSSEYSVATLRPALDISWYDQPSSPDLIAPVGGAVISRVKPLLIWQFDALPDDEQEQTSSQVQVSTSTDFSSPEYDSGKVANDEEQWDLSATAYAALSDGDTRYWRVKVWNQDDVASEWSVTESFEVQSKGTLAITSPGATVPETTPPISWTLTGRTQESRQVTLWRVLANGTLKRIYRWSRKTTTSQTVTVPENLIHSGPTYRVRVTVWDDEDRQAMPEDPDWVREEQDFTYERAGGPDSPTGLTATPLQNSPGILLEWEAASAPDFFSLRVDEEEVAQRIDPDDVHVSGTSYEMIYWGAQPRTLTTFEMEAVENVGGELDHSEDNATATASTKPRGIWLIDPDDDTAVEIDGRETVNQSVGETGTTYELVGRRAPVRITDSVRGYEGSITGVVNSSDERDDFLDLKGRLKTLRLVAGDANIPVILEPVAAAPVPLGVDALFSVSFGFVQVDEFGFEVEGL